MAKSEKSNGAPLEISLGQEVEVLDFNSVWHMGQVRRIDSWDNTVCIHLDGIGEVGVDEWFDLSSGRLRTLKKDTSNGIKIPKADRLAMASSIPLEVSTQSSDGGDSSNKVYAKDRKFSQFKKGTLIIASWVDGNFYPAVIIRIISEQSFVVEFGDGSRWALGVHCFVRTLTRSEYEKILDFPELADVIIGPQLINLDLVSPQPSDVKASEVPPPRKKGRRTSVSATPKPAKRLMKISAKVSAKKMKDKQLTSRKSLPPPKEGKFGDLKSRRKSSAPALGGSSSNFKSKASVRSVSPLCNVPKNADRFGDDSNDFMEERQTRRRLSTRERRPVQKEFPAPVKVSEGDKSAKSNRRQCFEEINANGSEASPTELPSALNCGSSAEVAPEKSNLRRSSRQSIPVEDVDVAIESSAPVTN